MKKNVTLIFWRKFDEWKNVKKVIKKVYNIRWNDVLDRDIVDRDSFKNALDIESLTNVLI